MWTVNSETPLLSLAFRHLKVCHFVVNTELINTLLSPCALWHIFDKHILAEILMSKWRHDVLNQSFFLMYQIGCVFHSPPQGLEYCCKTIYAQLFLCSVASFNPSSVPHVRSVSDSPAGACPRISLQPLRGNTWSLFIRTLACICFTERTMCSFSRWGVHTHTLTFCVWTKERLTMSFGTVEKLIQVQKCSEGSL